MNVYTYNFRKFIKQISRYYYMTLDRIKIEIDKNYSVYVITIYKKTNKYYIFKFILNKFNVIILYIIKKNMKKANIFLNNNKYNVINVYKK